MNGIRLIEYGSEDMSWVSVETLQGDRGCSYIQEISPVALWRWVELYPEAMSPLSWKLYKPVFDKALSEVNDLGLTGIKQDNMTICQNHSMQG